MFKKLTGAKLIVIGLIGLIYAGGSVLAQNLSDDIASIFTNTLQGQLTLSPGQHANHFLPSSVAASDATITAFSNFITTNIASFPISSSSAGLTFDFSSGQPVSTSTSLGPIFAERAQTLGKGRFNMSVNFSYLGLDKLRGIDMEDIRFTFAHENVAPAEGLPIGILGDNINEFDSIDLLLNMNLDASIMAFVANFGVTDRLDIGVAVPFVNVNVVANPVAEVASFSTALSGSPNHFFGADSTSPLLRTDISAIDNDATGVGDVAIRLKYNLMRDSDVKMSALLEYRAGTGDADNFLGTGETAVKGMVIFSGNRGDFSPHLNLAYDYRTSDLDRNQLQGALGFDQKLSETFSMAADIIGAFQIGKENEDLRFPDDVIINGNLNGQLDHNIYRRISPINFPRRSSDNIINASLGFKISPKQSLLLIGNLIAPLNDGGLRSDVIVTTGMEFSF